MGCTIADRDAQFLSWEEIAANRAHLHRLAFEQCISVWQQYEGLDNFPPLWGDEIEYLLVSLDRRNKTATLALKQPKVLKKWEELSKDPLMESQLHPESMMFMVESVAVPPYGDSFKAMLRVENDMKDRRVAIQACLGMDELPVTIPMFPRLGASGKFTSPDRMSSKKLYSHVMSEDLFSHFERSKVISDNLRGRRCSIAEANIPVFRDINTPWPWKDDSVDWGHIEKLPFLLPTPAPNCVLLDHFAWSGGACGLQTTFQAKNLGEARLLHDQLCPLSALMLALTAGSPCYKGYLVDTDSRWHVTNALNDDRSMEEMRSKNSVDQGMAASQMRWSFSPVYAGHGDRVLEGYQLCNTRNLEARALFEKAGMDPNLSRFFSHMLKYDHLIMDPDHLQPESPSDTYHFRALIGSLWPDIRFKPPPDGSNIGWRVEFRPMEVQMTDFENAAFVVFMALMRRAVSYFDLNFYLPMDLVGENMRRAVMRDAVNQNKFWFREIVLPGGDPRGLSPSGSDTHDSNLANGYREMSLEEIMCGSGGNAWSSSPLEGRAPFPGLVPLVHSLLDAVDVDCETRSVLNGYLEFVAKRASGDLWTTAKWMRHFIQTHEKYKADSVVSEEICYDLICTVEDFTLGRACGPTFKET
ncbi:Glutamate--cysteine ligase [Penicillium fimorum]|uniref:Glutamate--cysteine ligase n=1 Tax=Penicillium fimorum TaxID=1882269 RepID=A0A9X0C746_9EURO|nr:Glutamate--cysteine ligase [Penicillium fimorum]